MPTQVQTGAGKFLEGFLKGSGSGMQNEEQSLGQEKSQGRYFDAMRQLKERELGAKREEDMMDPDEANRLARGAGAPYHFSAPVNRSVVTSLIGDWLTSHTPKNLNPNLKTPPVPKFDMVSAQNKALGAAKASVGKAAGNLAYEDYTPEQAKAFNAAYQRSLRNDITVFERINKIRTGFAPTDYINPGSSGTGVAGFLGTDKLPSTFGKAKVKNTLSTGYDFSGDYGAPLEAPPGGGGKGGGTQPPPLKPLDDKAKDMIRTVRKSHPERSAAQMVQDLADPRAGGYTTTEEEISQVQ